MTEKKAYGLIGLVSILVIVFLFWLIYFNPGSAHSSNIISVLPSLNAFFNFLTASFLVAGYIQIKRGEKKKHIGLMLLATLSSACFLISYIIYHRFHGDTPYTGVGLLRIIYFFILTTHILLSIIQVPLIFITLYHGFSAHYEKHKKFARITFPIWLYVSVTGVLIFIFLNLF